MGLPRLFDKFDSYSALAHQKKGLQDELRNLTENKLKGTRIEEWIKFYYDKYAIEVPKINRDGIESDVEDTKVNARHHRHRVHFDEDDDDFIPIPGTEIRFYVPFEGDAAIFECSGNTLYASFPSAEIRGQSLIFRYQSAV